MAEQSDFEMNDDLLNEMGGLNRLNESLADLDERGLVLSLAAFAEDSLGDLLRAFMRSNEASIELLNGFNAPLGTFSARSKAALALGLITDDQFKDIEHLRKIRNAFSHTWKPISFATQSVRDRINKISYSSIDDSYRETPEDKIRSSISALLVELRVMIDQIHRKRLQVRVTGTRLIAGLSGKIDEQISTAKTSLSKLEADLSVAQGTKKEFLLMIRRRWVQRLEIIAANAGEEFRVEVREMIQELKQRIASGEH